MINWGGKKWVPGKPNRRQPINQSIAELMKPLGEKTFKGNVWGSQIMNVLKEEAQPTPTPTPSMTPTLTNTPTLTLTPTPTATTPLDPDASTYISALVSAGATIDSSTETTINTLFTSLKSNGLYNDIIAMYPMVGGTSATHAINAKQPGTFNANYVNAWTFNSSGSTGNGSNTYANTGIVPANAYSGGELPYVAYFTNNDPAGDNFYYDGSVSDFDNIIKFRGASDQKAYIRWGSGSFLSTGNTTPYGCYIFNRHSGGRQIVKNGSVLANDSTTTLTLPTGQMLFGAINTSNNLTPNPSSSSNRRYGMVMIGKNLSTGSTSSLNTIITNFNTSLNRVFSPSPTPTPTLTNTPTLTSTPTNTPTLTSTPTNTPTLTSTPTNTPTASVVPPSITYITSAEIEANQTSFTFSNVDYGGAGLIAVVITGKRNTNTERQFSSASLGGVGMTTIATTFGSFGGNCPVVAICTRRMTGGTSANIVVAFSGATSNAMDGCTIGVYRIQNNVSDTAHKSGTGSSNSGTASTTLSGLTAGSVGCAVSCHSDTAGSGVSWTNATENFDIYNTLADYSASGGALALASGNQNITAADGGNPSVVAAAVWL